MPRGPRDRLSAREFLARAVTWTATHGITQFIDLGCGIPAAAEYRRVNNLRNIRRDAGTHAIARAVNPAATVAYVDHDRIVTSEAPFLLEPAGPGIAVVAADLRDPETVLEDKGLREVIDLSAPVCLVLGLVLGLLPATQAREVIAGYADLVAPGSLFVLSCGRVDDAALWKQLRETYTAAPARNHARRTIAGFLGGLELVPPGLVPVQNWRGGWQDVPVAPPGPACVLGAVARKPAPRRARGLVAR
jgi:S-adenosyl methyltransferase